MTDAPPSWIESMHGAGVARLGSEDIAGGGLDEWVRATGRVLLSLDTQDCSTEAELQATVAATFGLDEDVAPEWDALDDCLADYDVAPAAGLVIVWTGWDGLDEDAEDAMPTAVDAFATAAQTWVDEGRPWAVLVVGDGPSWQLPWLGEGTPPWEDDTDDDLDGPDAEEWDEDEEEISDDSYSFDDEPSGDRVTPW